MTNGAARCELALLSGMLGASRRGRCVSFAASEPSLVQVTFVLAIVHQKTKEPVVSATFSKLFSKEAPSWGKNNFVDVSDILQADKSVYDDDTVLFHCSITAMSSIEHELEDAGIVSSGRQRSVQTRVRPKYA